MSDENKPTVPAAAATTAEKDLTILSETENADLLGFAYPTWKKWAILTSVFLVQLSMNFNAAIFSSAIEGLSVEFGVTAEQAEYGQAVFLICYAFGCEMWAPWSEELGRWSVMQGSLFLVNVWQIGCALAPNFGVLVGFRALGGLSSAGGSVTLGMVADMWEPADQQCAVTYVVLSSCAGSVIAPIAGGFIQTYLSWPWVFWISLIFGAVAQFAHSFVPETRSTIMLDIHARRLRKKGEQPNVYGPNEMRGSFWKRTSWKDGCNLMWKPYKFLLTEPIVTFCSLLSGFSDALIFTGLDSYGMVMAKWNFSPIQIGLCFIPLLLGYVLASLSFLVVYYRERAAMHRDPANYPPERRLWWLLYLVLLEPIGLFVYGFASFGPPQVHWIGPLICSGMIGIANLAIYQATIDYMVAAYGGEHSASATGGNGFSRDFLAGIAAFYARPMFTNIAKGTKWQLPIPSFILCGIGSLLVVPVFVFYFYGSWFRVRSPYAQKVEQEREARDGEGIELASLGSA